MVLAFFVIFTCVSLFWLSYNAGLYSEEMATGLTH